MTEGFFTRVNSSQEEFHPGMSFTSMSRQGHVYACYVGNPFKCNSISIYFGLKIKIARCMSILPNSF